MKRQLQLVVLLMALAASVFSVTGGTVAAQTSSATKTAARAAMPSIPVTGTYTAPGNLGSGTIQGSFTPQRFADQDGKLVLVGTLSGTATDANGNVLRHFDGVPVAMPASLVSGNSTSSSGQNSSMAAPMAAAACPILNLVLGPLNLNLLGLQVTLNQVVLNVNAIPGAGNLLGNLLCDVANLLNVPGLPLPALVDILNGILGLFGTL